MYSFILSFIKHWFEGPLVTNAVLGTGGPKMSEIRKSLHSSLVREADMHKISPSLVLYSHLYESCR